MMTNLRYIKYWLMTFIDSITMFFEGYRIKECNEERAYLYEQCKRRDTELTWRE